MRTVQVTYEAKLAYQRASEPVRAAYRTAIVQIRNDETVAYTLSNAPTSNAPGVAAIGKFIVAYLANNHPTLFDERSLRIYAVQVSAGGPASFGIAIYRETPFNRCQIAMFCEH